MNLKLIPLLFIGIIYCSLAPQGGKIVQIDISQLLNARPVTTYANGTMISWSKGIDGNGDGDGYLTAAASQYNGDKNANPLPDNPLFAATAQHPEILLHYNNNNTTDPQAMSLAGADAFVIVTPRDHYSAVYLGLSSSEGASSLEFELIYTSGKENKNYVLPDYYNDATDKNPGLSYVATNLAKWGKGNILAEKDHHNIHLLKLDVNSGKILKGIRVRKAKEGYLMLWSATGVTI